MKQTYHYLFAISLAIGCLACSKTEGSGHSPETTAGRAAQTENDRAEQGTGSAQIVLTSDAAAIAGIRVENARQMPMQGELKAPGTVQATAQGKAVVTPPADGRITRIFVKVGQSVRAGQPVATVQSADLAQASAGIIEAQRGVLSAKAAVREATAEIDLARGKLRTAKESLRRQQGFARSGAFSQPAVHAAERELSEAEFELEQGRQEQAVHQAQLERAERLFSQQLISRTELEQAKLEVEQDRIQQRNAEQRIAIARSAARREQSIARTGLSNSREIQAAEGEVRAANLDVERAKIAHSAAVAGVAGAEKGLSAARAGYAAQAGGNRASGGSVTVVAPIAGVVMDMEATLGQAVERTTEICEIQNLSSVWVTASVPERDIDKLRSGTRAQVAVSSFPGQLFSGVVQVLGSRLDPKSRTMPVHVLVANPSMALRTHMFATVTIGVGQSHPALGIPRSAVLEEGDSRLVYVAHHGGKYEARPVELGRSQGPYVEVTSGLKAGESVVSKGAFILKSEQGKSELKGD